MLRCVSVAYEQWLEPEGNAEPALFSLCLPRMGSPARELHPMATAIWSALLSLATRDSRSGTVFFGGGVAVVGEIVVIVTVGVVVVTRAVAAFAISLSLVFSRRFAFHLHRIPMSFRGDNYRPVCLGSIAARVQLKTHGRRGWAERGGGRRVDSHRRLKTHRRKRWGEGGGEGRGD